MRCGCNNQPFSKFCTGCSNIIQPSNNQNNATNSIVKFLIILLNLKNVDEFFLDIRKRLFFYYAVQNIYFMNLKSGKKKFYLYNNK